MQKEITTKTWFGNSVFWNRMYSAGKNKGTTNKGRKFNPKKDRQIAKRSLGQKIKCCLREERNAGFEFCVGH